MTSVLVAYMTRGGHTARIARALCEGVEAAGGQATALDVRDADKAGIDWARYDVVVVGAPVLYGNYDKSVMRFIERHKEALAAKPNAFFNVSVVARTPEKATVSGNRYMQKFLELSPWKPRELKVIAGKVDYPSWPWWDRYAIRLIMKMTHGPTDLKAVIDYTDWDDVRAWGRHLPELARVTTPTA
jgi:menaquinone-dependent protoporphyrinogen oxidase